MNMFLSGTQADTNSNNKQWYSYKINQIYTRCCRFIYGIYTFLLSTYNFQSRDYHKYSKSNHGL